MQCLQGKAQKKSTCMRHQVEAVKQAAFAHKLWQGKRAELCIRGLEEPLREIEMPLVRGCAISSETLCAIASRQMQQSFGMNLTFLY